MKAKERANLFPRLWSVISDRDKSDCQQGRVSLSIMMALDAIVDKKIATKFIKYAKEQVPVTYYQRICSISEEQMQRRD